MKLDTEKYIPMLDEFDMTDEGRIECIEIIWNMMCRFVEIGHGMDTHTLAEKARERDRRKS